MSTVEAEKIKVGKKDGLGSSAGFAQSMIPLFNGPRVKLRLVPSRTEYEVSLDLICEKSPYFAKMFQECFIEGAKGEATLEEIEGVVSPRSLENLLEWIYRGRIILASTDPQDQLSEGLEFLRMADMCDVHGMEQIFSDYMQEVLIKISRHERCEVILPQYIKSTSLLPREHPFRTVMAKAVVGFFVEDEEFSLSLSQYPSICADILKEVRTMCYSADAEIQRKRRPREVFVLYRDPLSKEHIRVKTVDIYVKKGKGVRKVRGTAL